MTPPNVPGTPVRTVRIPDDLWTALRIRADERGETVTAVVLRALRLYLGHYDD